ncbi:MAG: L,D-transpeptidase [Gammaproteobacteria bacterium]|jgi:L,D-transpeptidase YbiS
MNRPRYHIEISIQDQTLKLKAGEDLIREYSVSTSATGAGEARDSLRTPRGRHEISEKIGAGCEPDTVFVGRRPTGEVYAPALRDRYPDRDWILTRILRLAGTEDGVNRGGEVDSHDRYIYIHGAPDEVLMGRPGSHGCIRMRNADILELFELVEAGTPVFIKD